MNKTCKNKCSHYFNLKGDRNTHLQKGCSIFTKYYMEYCWITSACQTPMETHGVINMELPISFLQSKKL